MRKPAIDLEFSPSGKILVCHSSDQKIHLRDMTDYTEDPLANASPPAEPPEE